MTNKLKPNNKRNIYLALAVLALSAFGIGHTFLGGGWSKNTGEAAKNTMDQYIASLTTEDMVANHQLLVQHLLYLF